MIAIESRKGFDLNIQGLPTPELIPLPDPNTVAVVPERIPFVKPRLRIKKGDRVSVGSLLFEDKTQSSLKFLSPGGGWVDDIRLGPRRVIQEIVIRLGETEQQREFKPLTTTDLSKIDRASLVEAIVAGGLWALLRRLPFRDPADPEQTPPAIIVALGGREPFQPLPEFYLKDHVDLFTFGIQALRRLADDRVWVYADARDNFTRRRLKSILTHSVAGPYPADDPGVLLYHTRTSSRDNRAWYIRGEDVLLIAHLLRTGRYPTRRVVAVGGSASARQAHYDTRMGVPIAHLVQTPPDETVRIIIGGIWRGYSAALTSHLGLYETAVSVLPEGDRKEFLALFNPGYRKPTRSRAYLSRLNRGALSCDCNRHGGTRACIACMYCADVCPVDILPQLTYKAILAEEVEEYLEHGLLDCVECGLCSFVCPSKIELATTLKQAKNAYREEQIGQ